MRLSIRYENKFQTIELSEKETEQMWVTLSLDVSKELTDSQKEKLIQDEFDELFNKPEYNNWHKFDRHSATTTPPKKRNGNKGYVKSNKDDEDNIKHKDKKNKNVMENMIELYPDNSDEKTWEKQAEY
jgi:hypothetical protein